MRMIEVDAQDFFASAAITINLQVLNNSDVNDNVQLIGKPDYCNLPQQTGICQENFTGAAQAKQNFTEKGRPCL